jgi:MFS family permease
VASFILGGVSLLIFMFVEWRSRAPMLPLDLFRSTTFTGANLLTLFLYAALGGMLFFLPFNLIQVQGYSPTAAGAALLPFVLTMFLLSRWAGGLVARYGSKLPLVVGPIIAAVGFALFSRAGSGSYWSNFLPAAMVMSFGMAISVAPLTTTVMSAVDERHAGVASGINNAVSRTAGLLAVAVLGIVMIQTFNTDLERRLAALDLPPDARAQLKASRSNLAAIDVPQSLSEEKRREVQEAIAAAFVAGFRDIAYICAGLAFLSALAAWALIEGKPLERASTAAS